MRHPGPALPIQRWPGLVWGGLSSLDRPRRLRRLAAAGAQGRARLVAGPRTRRAVRGRDPPRRRTWEPASQHTPPCSLRASFTRRRQANDTVLTRAPGRISSPASSCDPAGPRPGPPEPARLAASRAGPLTAGAPRSAPRVAWAGPPSLLRPAPRRPSTAGDPGGSARVIEGAYAGADVRSAGGGVSLRWLAPGGWAREREGRRRRGPGPGRRGPASVPGRPGRPAAGGARSPAPGPRTCSTRSRRGALTRWRESAGGHRDPAQRGGARGGSPGEVEVGGAAGPRGRRRRSRPGGRRRTTPGPPGGAWWGWPCVRCAAATGSWR